MHVYIAIFVNWNSYIISTSLLYTVMNILLPALRGNQFM